LCRRFNLEELRAYRLCEFGDKPKAPNRQHRDKVSALGHDGMAEAEAQALRLQKSGSVFQVPPSTQDLGQRASCHCARSALIEPSHHL